MFRLFDQPYPSLDPPSRQLRKALIIGLFIGLFLLIFQPFGLTLWKTPNKSLKIMGFGVITFVITAFNFTVWPLLFPKQFSDKQWTVGREILLVTANILLIAIANRLYLGWLINEAYISDLGWPGMILATFLVGLFPVTAVVLLNYIAQLKKYSGLAAELPVYATHSVGATDSQPDSAIKRTREKPFDTHLTLVADNEKDTLTFSAANLLFIESTDNYCTVVYLKDGPVVPSQLSKPLLRTSLSRLEGQIAGTTEPDKPHIVRCHRSFVVNLDRVERVTGNAQGYKLHLLDGQFQVPVARKYNDSLVSQLKALA